MKYYVFFYYDNAGGGRHQFLADNEKDAYKKLRRFLNEYHPFRRYKILLEQVLSA